MVPMMKMMKKIMLGHLLYVRVKVDQTAKGL